MAEKPARYPIRRLLACLATALAMLVLPVSAYANKRIALVIGIQSYDNLTKLNNPSNDARAVANLFSENGIKATVKLDRGEHTPGVHGNGLGFRVAS